MTTLATLSNQLTLESKRFRDLPQGDQLKLISEALAMAYTMQGQQLNKDDITSQTFFAHRIIERNYAHLYIDRLKFIVEEGIIEKYGKNFGINAKELCRWIGSYMESEQRTIDINHLNALKLQMKPIKDRNDFKLMVDYYKYLKSENIARMLSVEETDWLNRYSIALEFNQYNGLDRFEDLGGGIYNYLTSKGFINPEQEERQQAWIEAEPIAQHLAVAKRNPFTKAMYSQDKHKIRITIAKSILITKYFKDCKEQELDIFALLKLN